MKLQICIVLLLIYLEAIIMLPIMIKPEQSFLALKSNENFEDDYGDFNMEEHLVKDKRNKGNKIEEKSLSKKHINSSLKEQTPKQNRKISKSEKHEHKINDKSYEKLNVESKEITNKVESDNLIKKLNPNFLKELLKLQNNPVLGNFSNKLNKNPSKMKIDQIISNRKNGDFKLKVITKNDVLDSSKFNYLDNLIRNMVNEIDKKTLQNTNYFIKNNNLEKSYESTNNQIMILQSKLESILQEMKYISEVKNGLTNQNGLIKQSSVYLTNSNEVLKKNVDNLEDKIVKLDSFNEKIGKKVKNFKKEQKILVNKNIQRAKEFEDMKIKYEAAGDSKDKLVKLINNSFEKFDIQELKFLDNKEKENKMDLSIKNEENTEKLLSLEIEHLKASNMLEIQKVEEMKQEIEKSKNMKENLEKEIDELEDKLRSIENETKEKQMEYEIKKNEYEDNLNKAKTDINLLRMKKNAIINNNKIITLDNIKKKTPEVKKSPIKDETINFLEKNTDEVKDNNIEKNLDELLKKNGINSMNDLEDKLNKFKGDNDAKTDEDIALKNQILSLINTIKN